jgi:hypothetical protein
VLPWLRSLPERTLHSFRELLPALITAAIGVLLVVGFVEATDGDISPASTLVGAFTVEVGDNGIPYIAIDPEALGQNEAEPLTGSGGDEGGTSGSSPAALFPSDGDLSTSGGDNPLPGTDPSAITRPATDTGPFAVSIPESRSLARAKSFSPPNPLPRRGAVALPGAFALTRAFALPGPFALAGAFTLPEAHEAHEAPEAFALPGAVALLGASALTRAFALTGALSRRRDADRLRGGSDPAGGAGRDVAGGGAAVAPFG